MPIFQPSYPVETNELVTHVGAYTDTTVAAHTGDSSAAHAASAISFSATGSIAATDVQAAVAEVATDAASALTAHTGDSSDAHDASAISYAGGTGMSATDVEAAIDELATEKLNVSAAIGHNVFGQTTPGTWDARPTGYFLVFWHGGDASTDDPSANMDVNDIWFPDSE